MTTLAASVPTKKRIVLAISRILTPTGRSWLQREALRQLN